VNSRFVRLPYGVPSAGFLTALRKRERGDPLRVIVPLLLNGGSVGHNGARIRWDDLSEWSGVGKELRLEEALLTLQNMSAIQRISQCYQSPIAYSANPRLLAQSGKGYVLPARLVTDGIWRGLSGAERAILWAIAANVRTHLWDEDCDSYEVLRWSEDFVAGFENGAAVLSPRTGLLSLSTLSELTGITRAQVSRTLKRLHDVKDGDLLIGFSTDGGWWHHLPEAIWFDSRDSP